MSTLMKPFFIFAFLSTSTFVHASDLNDNPYGITLSKPDNKSTPLLTQKLPPVLHIQAVHQSNDDPRWVLQTEDKTVQGALIRWAKAAGWHLSWEMPDGEDLKFDQSASFTGDFASAVKSLAATLAQSPMPIKAILYSGNHVLRIVPVTSGAD